MCIAYLQPQVVQETALTPGLLTDTQGRIRSSIAAMQSRLRDVEQNVGHIDDFPMTDDVTRCSHCVFRRLCGRE